VPVADAEQHPQGFGPEPSGDERENVQGRRVEPMRVVDDQQHGRLAGGLAEQVERSQSDHEELWGTPRGGRLGHSEGPQQRFRLNRGQTWDLVQHRSRQLVQPGEGQMALGLHAGRGEHGESRALRLARGPCKERGLADARSTADHERPACLRQSVDEGVESGELLGSAE
jgi:hypothetical protein